MHSSANKLSDAAFQDLFDNREPLDVWLKTCEIVRRISPAFDFSLSRRVFDDVLRLFEGSYPGYTRIQTPYHDLRHTLDVFICAVRLMHGIHLSQAQLSDEEINLILISAMLHDIGYAQRTDEIQGTGAQHTKTHVGRGIAFLENHRDAWQLPSTWIPAFTSIILCTNMGHNLANITFPSPRIRLLGQIVASADLVGQMADRAYLEKLLFLFLEFKEAEFGEYNNTHDLLKKTRQFYDLIRKTLEGALGGIFHRLKFHFKDWVGVENNFYLESIERNITYLDRVISMHETEWFAMLKRHGIVKAFQKMSNQPQ
jgi:hypothetical protein